MALLLSDIHFGKNRPSDVARVRKAAKDIAQNGDGIVIVAGDFTQRATGDEYRASEELIRDFIDFGCIVVATPGNHDFGFHGLFGKGTDKLNLLPTRLDKSRKRYRRHVLEPILEQDHERAEILHGTEDGYDTITRVGDDVFVSLRSTHRPRWASGRWQISRIREHQAVWASETLRSKEWGGLRIHLVTHRSLWQTISDTGDKHKPMKNRRVVEELLIEPFDVETVIHGHNHALRFERVETPKLGIEVLRIGVPTLSERVGFPGMMGHAFLEWDPAQPDVTCVDGDEGRVEREVGFGPDVERSAAVS